MEYKKLLQELVDIVVKENGSDLHFSEGNHPTIRVSGNLIPLAKQAPLTPEDTFGLMSELLPPEHKEVFLKNKEFDFSYAASNKVRFRGSAFFQQGSISIALRLIPHAIKTLDELNIPPIVTNFARLKQGFFLVVGPVGQGKSTTLASMIEMINSERAEHIITIEDPIEYIFEQKKSIIDQREIGLDTSDFHAALKSMFRQDVDVAMIGEMRDPETMAAAVTAAETGHLIFSTLHTNNAAQTIDRIIDAFPANGQDQIRMQLAGSLAGILSQRLVPKISGGLIPACELLINNNAVSNLIRERRTHEINTVIETGMENGMIDINRSLAELVRSGQITIENARAHSINPRMIDKMI
jgi:twitching motility protein PilT